MTNGAIRNTPSNSIVQQEHMFVKLFSKKYELEIYYCQTRLGQGNIATTQRNLHAIKDADEEAVNALQNLLITQHKASEEAKRKAE